MRASKSPHNRFAVIEDESVFITHYVNTGDVRIRFEPKGYVPEGLFRFVLRAMQNPHKIKQDKDTVVLTDGSIKFVRGPCTIIAKASGREVTMHATVRLPEGVTQKTLRPAVVDEIEERLDQLKMIAWTFPRPVAEDDQPRRESGKNGHAAPTPQAGASTAKAGPLTVG